MIEIATENNLVSGWAIYKIFSEDLKGVTFRIQHSRNVEIFFCDIKGQIEIFQWVVLKMFNIHG